jgi:hypothetical protein
MALLNCILAFLTMIVLWNHTFNPYYSHVRLMKTKVSKCHRTVNVLLLCCLKMKVTLHWCFICCSCYYRRCRYCLHNSWALLQNGYIKTWSYPHKTRCYSWRSNLHQLHPGITRNWKYVVEYHDFFLSFSVPTLIWSYLNHSTLLSFSVCTGFSA